MSVNLINFAKEFVAAKVTANDFADAYIDKWRQERNKNILKNDAKDLSECASDIFILADCYNPENDRESYELDEKKLRTEVKSALVKFKFL